MQKTVLESILETVQPFSSPTTAKLSEALGNKKLLPIPKLAFHVKELDKNSWISHDLHTYSVKNPPLAINK